MPAGKPEGDAVPGFLSTLGYHMPHTTPTPAPTQNTSDDIISVMEQILLNEPVDSLNPATLDTPAGTIVISATQPNDADTPFLVHSSE